MVAVVVQEENSLCGNGTEAGEQMGSASEQELEIREYGMTPNDAAHSTNLHCILSLYTDGEALDIVRRMVARWEPNVPARFW